MQTRVHRSAIVGLVGVLLVAPWIGGGCHPVDNYWGQNVNINLTIPLGLTGTPGIFNLFGLLGSLATTTTQTPAAGGTSTIVPPPAV